MSQAVLARQIARLAAYKVQKRAAVQGPPVAPILPQTDDELWAWVFHTWNVAIPRTGVCPGHVSPFQAFADAYFARDSMIVWEASRGLGGKSFLLALLGLTIACTRGGDVNILGGSGEQSKRVHDYMVRAWDQPQAPRRLLRSHPLSMRTRLSNGSTVLALLASSRSIRGPHTPTLLLDECDEFDLALFDAALGQTMATATCPPVTVMSSTHHYPDKTFTVIKQRAQERHWLSHTWCYRETLQPHGWLAPSEVERKRRETTAAMFAAEYDLQEPSPESRAILPEAVQAMFRREWGVFAGHPREYLEVEPPEADAFYAHGADWARSQDWTEILTLNVSAQPARLVAYERMQRLPWPVMVGRFEERIRRYGGQAIHDGTGLGDVVDGYLTISAEAVQLVGRRRADLFSEYISAIERGAIAAPYIEGLERQHRYASVEDIYGSGHPPDGFVAGALAWHGRRLDSGIS
jgi:hypothetical protein